MNIADHARRVEADYGEPFVDVVLGYCRDKESVTATALILDIPASTFRRWLRNNLPDASWEYWPNTNSWQASKKVHKSPAITAAARANLVKAQALNAVRFKETRFMQPDMLAQIAVLRRRGVSWRQMPAALGVKYHHSTMRREYRKHSPKD